jgi:hypothetical protein
MKYSQPFLNYLATCSEASLRSFELARLNEVANLRQQLSERLAEIVEQMVEAGVQARLAGLAFDRRRASSRRVAQSQERRRGPQNKNRRVACSASTPAASNEALMSTLDSLEAMTRCSLPDPRGILDRERVPLAPAS